MEQPTRELADYPLAELYKEREALDLVLADFKARANAVDGEIGTRTAEAVKAIVAASGKTHGVINAPLLMCNSLTAKVDISKKVDWDTGKLMAIAQTLPWDRVKAIFKIDFSVSETIYKGLEAAAPELFKQIEAARTVKYGEPKLTLVPVEGAI